MRLVYIDEGGISQHEPFVVVAGVVIDADKELIALEDHLGELVEKHIPADDREGFVFHATEIFSGTKYFADREKWPLEKRFAILGDLVAIPEKFGLPISFGFIEKAKFPNFDLRVVPTMEDRENAAYAVALLQCTLGVEKMMRDLWPDEVAILIAEDRQKVRAAIKSFHSIYRSPAAIKAMGVVADALPLTRIRDTVHFAKKSESAHLQLADMCTYVIKGNLLKHPRNPPFYEALHPWLFWNVKKDEREQPA